MNGKACGKRAGAVLAAAAHRRGASGRRAGPAVGEILRHFPASASEERIQKEVQSALLFECPSPADQPPLYVGMPYLPLYVILFLPFTLVEFTASYFIWLSLQLGIFLYYL